MPPITGSPLLTVNPPLGIATLNENALPVMRWQPVQWQAIANSGGAEILIRTFPQRQPPSHGKLSFVMFGFLTMNPWTSIWLKPRATIQQIVDSNPTRWVLLLAAMTGFSSALDQASLKSLGDKYEMPVIFVMAAIAGPICGIIALYIGGALLRWTGAWIGGQGSAQHIRAAVAWSSVPYIWGLLLWIPAVLLFGNELFTIETPEMDANLTLLMWYLGIGVLQLIIATCAPQPAVENSCGRCRGRRYDRDFYPQVA